MNVFIHNENIIIKKTLRSHNKYFLRHQTLFLINIRLLHRFVKIFIIEITFYYLNSCHQV